MSRMSIICAVLLLLVACPPSVRACEWSHLGRDARRSGATDSAPASLANALWTVTPPTGESFVGRASPVVSAGVVVVASRGFSGPTHVYNAVMAYSALDGEWLWSTKLVPDTLNSWSSPCIDLMRGSVLAASDNVLCSIDLQSGGIAWCCPLDQPVVNASPAVTCGLMRSLVQTDRALICDYDPVGGGGKLYAINVDPFDLDDNPYLPGEIVWTYPVGGTAGASPAYADGVVYVAEAYGHVLAIDVEDGDLIWDTDIAASGYPQFGGFFGGLTVAGGAVYGATYDFYGSGNNSGLVKLDAADGGIVWAIASERTDSIPIAPGDGRVYLSAGITGFGSAVKIQAFQDNGSSAALLWDTKVDPEGALSVGGWTHHMAYSGGYLFAGRPDPMDPEGAYMELLILDTTKSPADSGFVVDRSSGSGGSPAIADGVVYSIGTDGLRAYGPPHCVEDITGDGKVDLLDLSALLIAFGTSSGQPGFDPRADFDQSGTIDLGDLSQLLIVFGTAC